MSCLHLRRPSLYLGLFDPAPWKFSTINLRLESVTRDMPVCGMLRVYGGIRIYQICGI